MTPNYWELNQLAKDARESGDIYRFEENVSEAAKIDLYGTESEPAIIWQ